MSQFFIIFTDFLAMQARPLLKEKNYPRLIDQRIMDSHDVHQLFWMVRMAEKCLTRDPAARLTMDKVSLHVPSLSTQNMYSLCVKTRSLRIQVLFYILDTLPEFAFACA
jgi:hypothetical protein